MTADDEFRKMAEDVRGLARALKSELKAAKWEAKSAARDARRAWRWDAWGGCGPHRPPPPPRWWEQSQGRPPPPPPPPTAGGAPPQPPAGGAPPPAWAPPWATSPWRWDALHHGRVAMASPPPKPAAPPAPPVRHKRDGSTLASLLLVLVGLAWLGSASGVVSLSLETVLAAVLVVLGAAMVVTARTDWSLSRRHWPVWLGVVLLVLVMASAGTAGGLSRLHFGPTTVSPGTGDLGAPITNFAGPIRVNLPSSVPPKGATLRVHDVFGPVSVVLPHDAAYQLRVDARSRFGPVNVAGAGSGRGMFSHKTTTIGTSGPTLTLDVTDVFGPVSVDQGT